MPLQVPKKYENAFAFIKDPFRRVAHAMANYLDDQLGEIVDALKRRAACGVTLSLPSTAIMAERFLVRERVAATTGRSPAVSFPTGKAAYASMRSSLVALSQLRAASTAEGSLSAVWDWYATYAHLAGVDPTDHAAAAVGLPPIDSVNLWPLLARGKADGAAAPRDELPIGDTGALPNGDGKALVGGLLWANGTRLSTCSSARPIAHSSSTSM